jgi:preprotein translocase subunit YajC
MERLLDFFIPSAHAQMGGGDGGLAGLLPIILLFVIFYFLLIRPQQKRAKEHKGMVQGLSKGDEVVTQGGLLGRITKVSDTFITVEITDGVEVIVQRHMVGTLMPKGTIKSV